MFRILILNTALILLTAAKSAPPAADKEVILEIPVWNRTDLEEQTHYSNPIPTIFNTKVYAVSVLAKVNWITAQQICGYHGMTLATIQSVDDAQRLQLHLINNGLARSTEHFWIGASDLGTRDLWVWLTNGRPLTYSNWAAGEPNNFGGNESCLVMYPSGLWNDLDCDAQKFFICENRCDVDSYSVPLYPNL